MVYSASADGKIKVWGKEDKSSHSLKGILQGQKDVSMNSLILCDDGRFVYGAGSDGCIMCWKRDVNLSRWKMVCEQKAYQMVVLCSCSVGKYVCSGSDDKSIGIWKREVSGGIYNVVVIRGHEGPVNCSQASSHSVGGGFLLYSGGLDRNLRVWWVAKEESKRREGSFPMQQIMKGKMTSCVELILLKLEMDGALLFL